jgi:arylsulfatase A-like enzyme
MQCWRSSIRLGTEAAPISSRRMTARYPRENSLRAPRWSRRALLQGALGLTSGAVLANALAVTKRAPHIVFILADDMGYADLSCYGRRDYQTPVLDRLASQGVMLMHGYANSSICSPTRVALITGRYQYRLRVGLEEPLSSKNHELGLPPSRSTLPALLRERGYSTSLVGKWHMGGPPEFGPLKSGYERFFGIVGGATDYFTHRVMFDKQPSGGGLYDADVPVERVGYLTDLLGDRAVAEIKRAAKQSEPLFLSVHFTAPHWPWEGPEDEAIARTLTDSRHRDGGSLRTYAAMVQRLDANVGRILAALEDAGMAENALVIFTSDNGGERFSDTWPFVGGKGELLEGGIRVPLLVRWPNRIRPGTRSDQVLVSMDWLPTLLAAAGGEPSPDYPSDGMNLLSVLTHAAPPLPRKIFWRFKASQQAAVRAGSWKYLKLADREYLFDVVMDPRERADLSEQHPEVFVRLRSEFAAWNETMLPYPAESNSESAKLRTADRY